MFYFLVWDLLLDTRQKGLSYPQKNYFALMTRRFLCSNDTNICHVSSQTILGYLCLLYDLVIYVI